MYINKLMFVVITSQGIKFRSKLTLMVPIKKITDLYYKRTLKCTNLLMEPELQPMRDNKSELEGPSLNKTSAKEHFPEI